MPDAVRKALHLDKRDRLRYTVLADGVVQISRLDAIDDVDPTISGFLNFLANDMTAQPQHVQPMTSALLRQIQQLTALRYRSVSECADLSIPQGEREKL